ncbi:hypothetical protein SJH87_13320, partial [Staphylococcus sp. GCP4]|nr:hypothetical protein [Staphylococcus sp. GCP4]
ENSKMMLANIASIEIPPIYCTYLEWLQKQEASHLQRYGVKKRNLARSSVFYREFCWANISAINFLRLVDQARKQKICSGCL